MNNKDYDVVLDTLQKQRDILWKMMMNIMDDIRLKQIYDIRLKQIYELDKAMELWKERK